NTRAANERGRRSSGVAGALSGTADHPRCRAAATGRDDARAIGLSGARVHRSQIPRAGSARSANQSRSGGRSEWRGALRRDRIGEYRDGRHLHLREGDSLVSTQPLWLAQRERGSAWLMRALLRLVLTLGPRTGRALLYPICAYFFMSSRAARKASRDYLRRVLPRKPRLRDLFAHQLCFARTILHRIFLLSGRLDDFD